MRTFEDIYYNNKIKSFNDILREATEIESPELPSSRAPVELAPQQKIVPQTQQPTPEDPTPDLGEVENDIPDEDPNTPITSGNERVDQLANSILAGKFGNEPQRTPAILAAGFTEPERAQAQGLVNQKVSSGKPMSGSRHPAYSGGQGTPSPAGIMTWGPLQPKGICMHHTAGPLGLQKTIQVLNQRGGLGYHYFIDQQGQVTNLAPPNQVVYHAGRTEKMPQWHNWNLIGISLDAANDNMTTPQQENAAADLAIKLGQQFGFDPSQTTFGHGELTARKQPTEGKSATDKTEVLAQQIAA